MASKAMTWSVVGPAIWIVILVVVASQKADGASDTEFSGRPAVVAERIEPGARECPVHYTRTAEGPVLQQAI